jgi:hypothetical protein
MFTEVGRKMRKTTTRGWISNFMEIRGRMLALRGWRMSGRAVMDDIQLDILVGYITTTIITLESRTESINTSLCLPNRFSTLSTSKCNSLRTRDRRPLLGLSALGLAVPIPAREAVAVLGVSFPGDVEKTAGFGLVLEG